MAKAGCQFITVLIVWILFGKTCVQSLTRLDLGRCCSQSCMHVPSQGSCSFISFACYICKHLGRIKARAHELTPTITCTSSNVVQTILKGFLYHKFKHTIWT